MASDPRVRAGDSDREVVAASLREAFAQGRITQIEFEERLDRMHAAQTIGDLAVLTADLPRESSASVVPGKDFTGQDLTGAKLRGADLARANLAGAILADADLTGADLSFADLTGADLAAARLTGANLTGATLIDADLSDAVLARANLTGADLSGADLAYTDLSGADLTGAVLTGRGSARNPSRNRAVRRSRLRQGWTAWLGVSALVNVIWAASWAAGGDSPTYYWPIWVMGPWGVVMVLATFTGRSSDEPTP